MRLGVPLPGDVYDEHGTLLLSKNQILDSQSQLDKLVERGLYVEISSYEAHYSHLASSAPAPEPERFDPFLIRGTMRVSLTRMLHGIIAGSARLAQVMEFADEVHAYAGTDADAAIAASLLDHDGESRSAAHCLSTAILCSLLSNRLGWSRERQRSVIGAALTMNLGMLDLQKRLSRQSTVLAASQLEQVHAHPEASVAALMSIAVDDSTWLAAVREHHENPNGKGYPQQLTTVTDEGQLLRIVDVFFARASARADRPPLPPSQIVRHLFVEEGQGPCAPLVTSLVKTLGFYPPGSFVKLASGETGVVFRNGESPKTPVAASVTNAAGVPTMQPVRRDTSRTVFAIVGTLAPNAVSVGYDLGKLWIAKATPR